RSGACAGGHRERGGRLMVVLNARTPRAKALRAKLARLRSVVAAWMKMIERAAQFRGGSAARPPDESESLREVFRPHVSQIKLVCGGLEAMHCAIERDILDAER